MAKTIGDMTIEELEDAVRFNHCVCGHRWGAHGSRGLQQCIYHERCECTGLRAVTFEAMILERVRRIERGPRATTESTNWLAVAKALYLELWGAACLDEPPDIESSPTAQRIIREVGGSASLPTGKGVGAALQNAVGAESQPPSRFKSGSLSGGSLTVEDIIREAKVSPPLSSTELTKGDMDALADWLDQPPACAITLCRNCGVDIWADGRVLCDHCEQGGER